jgi:hypothetical protein
MSVTIINLEEIGNFIIFKIKKRTSEGRDVRGMFFQPYSPSYKFWRRKWGYQTDKVDLTLTGGMMNAMTYRVSMSKQEVSVFFMPGTSRKSRGQQERSKVQHPAKAFYLQKKRNFFSLAKVDEEKIRSIYENSIRDALSKPV